MKKGNQYKKGANRERQLVHLLYRFGAVAAARSAGSHSPIDVWADFTGFTYRAQCKAGVKPPQEVEDELLDLSLKVPYADYALWWFPDRQPPHVKVWRNGELRSDVDVPTKDWNNLAATKKEKVK